MKLETLARLGARNRRHETMIMTTEQLVIEDREMQVIVIMVENSYGHVYYT